MDEILWQKSSIRPLIVTDKLKAHIKSTHSYLISWIAIKKSAV